MCRKPNTRLSDFDRSERFSYKNIPEHFDSIRSEALVDLEEKCKNLVQKSFKNKYHPSATQSMLRLVSGKFTPAYTELEGDYRTRKANLERAFTEGEKDLYSRLARFEKLVSDHNLAFRQYSEALVLATGVAPDQELVYSKSNYTALKKEYERLKEKTYES